MKNHYIILVLMELVYMISAKICTEPAVVVLNNIFGVEILEMKNVPNIELITKKTCISDSCLLFLKYNNKTIN